jgi:xylulose-5-phosphate/fructose-6-phosphate phosphoketolase
LTGEPFPLGRDDLPTRQPALANRWRPGLTYRRKNHDNLHVRGYRERGNINTPMELAIQNEVDRFTLAIDAIDRVPSLRGCGAHDREALLNQQIDCRNYAYEEGIDMPEITRWRWPG